MTPYWSAAGVDLYQGDALEVLRALPSESARCCVTSPPYWRQRSYLPDGHPDKALELGTEDLPTYLGRLLAVCAEVRRVLADDGVLWLNLGDSYAGSGNGGGGIFAQRRKAWRQARPEAGWNKAPDGLANKQLIGVPWRVAFALQDAGWWLRNEIIWHAPNKSPESIKDRMARKHEHLFLITKSPNYYFDLDAVREPCEWNEKRHERIKYAGKSEATSTFRPPNPKGKNPGTVWSIPSVALKEEHFAAMPPELARRCILAGSRVGERVLDPFAGRGTTGLEALRAGRTFVGVELFEGSLELCRQNLSAVCTGVSSAEASQGQGSLFGGAA